MDVIRLLPDSVANQIAAGEVIQRPSSVIKELVENAVDAGATRIDVIVTDAGRTNIQVIDNGKGMSETDARLSFERHATSKIRQAADLFELHTMGFRGEALASIAAVAQVELLTRTPDSDLGTQILLEGCRVTGQKMATCPVGSNFQVKNLFFNVPARRKFLKSNQTELNNIVQEYERMALVNPAITFSLIHNGVQMSNLPASGVLQRIVEVFGRKIQDKLLPVEVETSLCRLSGYVGKPESSRKKGAQQYFFVNGRYMRHPYFHKAVQEAFDKMVPVGEQVPYFLYFELDPQEIDVNIHPTKTEIKFENEPAIWQIILAAVKETLGRFNAVPSIDFDQEGNFDMPAMGQRQSYVPDFPKTSYDTTYNPFKEQGSQRNPKSDDWMPLYDSIRQSVPDYELENSPSLFPAETQEQQPVSPQHSGYMQYKGRYILTAVSSGLMIIDQERAHERLLYDRYRQRMASHKAVSQGLLFPEVLPLAPADAALLEEVMEQVTELGFDITSLGGGSYSIQAVPAGTESMSPSALIQYMLDTVREQTVGIKEDVQHRLAFSLARRTATAVGEVLTQQDMEALITELFACEIPNYAPDGKTIVSIIQQQDIDKLF